MKKKNISISMRLKKAKSYQVQMRVLSDWSRNWHDDQQNTLQELRSALRAGDYTYAIKKLNQMDGMTTKRFAGLNNVLRILSDPDRHLVDMRNDQCTKPVAEEHVLPVEAPVDESSDLNKTQVTNETADIIEEIVKCYNAGMSLREIAKWSNVNTHKIIKILVTAGVYSSETYEKVKYMRECGKSDDEIAEKLLLNKSAMNDYTPYEKGIYNLDNPSENALNIRRCRSNTKT